VTLTQAGGLSQTVFLRIPFTTDLFIFLLSFLFRFPSTLLYLACFDAHFLHKYIYTLRYETVIEARIFFTRKQYQSQNCATQRL